MAEASANVAVKFDYIPAVSYALYQNYVPIIRQLSVENQSGKEWISLTVSITPSEGFAEPLELHADSLVAGDVFQPENIRLILKPAFINSLTEQMACLLKLGIKVEDEIIHQQEYPIDLLAYDQWLGAGILPEMLSAFVMPNLPELTPILKATANTLAKWTGESALNDYQSQSADRVKKQMAALYAAIVERKITYCSVPASFGGKGQRVRLVDTVLETGMGNCLEMTLLYASCLEAMGLHPLLILIKGHAFVGAWLVDETFPDAVNDDPSLLTKRIAAGINEILVIEATAMNADRNPSFDDAIQLAANHFLNSANFNLFIDVHRSRFSGIRPMPMRRKNGQDWEILDSGANGSGQPDAVNPESLGNTVKLTHVDEINFGKQQLWERKLLDLTLRNNLLNLRISKSSLQLIPVPPNELEDAIAGGEEFEILARPKDWDNPLRSAGIYQSLNSQDPMLQLVRQELKQKRLRVYLPEEELYEGLVGLYRNARQAMEENGANTLYLAIGLLRWYETPTSERPRFGPLMLMPVELIRKSVKKGFIIRSREEDTVLNITLMEKLRQDYGITLSGLDPLPKDESGVDVKLVFNIIRQAVMSLPRWDVEEQILLGTFSFSKFIMWNDIHSNAGKMKENPIVSGLIEGTLTTPLEYLPEQNLDEKYGYEDLLLPIDADSSQLQAISAAAAGHSFVLHGPPGTGKSQTITNIIANALCQGKRVLFVAEKMAALSVVQSRLSAIGLAPFCLELHSNKARKSEVLNQLQRTIETIGKKPPDNFKMEAQRLNQLRKVLNEYVNALHRKQDYGYSLYDLFNEYARYPRAKDDIKFHLEALQSLDQEKLVQWMDLGQDLQTSAGLCGGASRNHPLFGLAPAQYSTQIKEQVGQALAAFIESRQSLDAIVVQITRLLQWANTEWDGERLQMLNQIAEAVLRLPDMPGTFLRTEQLSLLEEELLPILDAGERQSNLGKQLLQQFQSTLLTAPINELLADWNRAGAKWFLPRYFGQKRVRQSLYGYLKTGKIAIEEVSQVLLDTLQYQECKSIVDRHAGYLKETLERFWKNGEPHWEQIRKSLNEAMALNGILLQWDSDILFAYQMRVNIGQLFQKGKDYFMGSEGRVLQGLAGKIGEEEASRRRLEELLGCALPFVLNSERDGWLEKAAVWQQHIEGLKNWFNWTQVRKKAIAANLEGTVKAYEEEQVSTDKLFESFKKSLYRSLAGRVIESDQQLAAFSGQYFEVQIEKFKELTAEFTRLTQATLYARLAANIPVFSQGAVATSEAGILQKAIKSNGRGVSIRQLFNSIPNLLPRLTPCMLMSPISVAQYLDINNAPFDLILFDEASQMPTSEAVGTIARGKSLIVVGDPKQMPPTSFFSSIHFDEEDTNEDLESILDDCQALSVPSRQLRWHYRSQHESLIAFSNARYYDNSLFTFPSPDDLSSRVQHVPVKGTYDRGKTRQNRAEAEAIVREIVRLLSQPAAERKSIGVVTFSAVQQALIEDLLNDEFAKRPALEEINNKSPEPLFIKNLENVQGDERDIILFSICYGPDEAGQVSINFGPLNRDGGWRRLNVAVSRARYLMKIYASVRSEQIDLSRTRSQGVAGLQAFLAFAEKGKAALNLKQPEQLEKHARPALEESVAAFLRANGYEVNMNVGCSGYRIDMAVIHPERPGEYMAGILFDGYRYMSYNSARDRNVVQSAVLNRLGWKVFRIWALDWWENRDKVVQSLLAWLEEAKSGVAPAPVPAPAVIDSRDKPQDSMPNQKDPVIYNNRVVAEEIKPAPFTSILQDGTSYPLYEVVNLPVLIHVGTEDFLSLASTETLKEQIKQVIETESPVVQSLICGRVIRAWGINRMGTRIQARFEQVFGQMRLKTTIDTDGNICYWKEGHEPDQFSDFRLPGKEQERRTAEEIPAVEIANAVATILSSQISLPEDDLVKETARLFQYGRVGGNVEAAMQRGIREAVRRGQARRENGRIVYVKHGSPDR